MLTEKGRWGGQGRTACSQASPHPGLLRRGSGLRGSGGDPPWGGPRAKPRFRATLFESLRAQGRSPRAPPPRRRVIDGPPRGPGDRCPRPPRAGARPGRVGPGERPGLTAPLDAFSSLPHCLPRRRLQFPGATPGPGAEHSCRCQGAACLPVFRSGLPGAAPLQGRTKGAPQAGRRTAAGAPPGPRPRGWRGTVRKPTRVLGVVLRHPFPPGPGNPSKTPLRASARPGAATTSGEPSGIAPESGTAPPAPQRPPPHAPPPSPDALNRRKVPRGRSGRARGGGSSCAVTRSGTKARPPVPRQVNTRFVMEMSAGRREQMIRGFGKRRPRPGTGGAGERRGGWGPVICAGAAS